MGFPAVIENIGRLVTEQKIADYERAYGPRPFGIGLGETSIARELKDKEIAAFREEGVVHVRSLIGQDMVVRLLAVADARRDRFEAGDYDPDMSRHTPREDGRTFFQERLSYRENEAFRDFIFEGSMARAAGQALGAQEVRFYFDRLFMLDQDTAKDVYQWHQGACAWACDGSHICSFWLALTANDADSGALEFVKGSHRGEFYPFRLHGENGDAAVPEYHKLRDRYDILSWAVEPGDALLFDARIMHTSRGNHSKTRRRVAYSTRWIGENARHARWAGFQDPITEPGPGVALGDPLAKSGRFPLLWKAS